ncbi:hypothetical protein [Leptospira bandrabouensis]|uniref:hypothetical protein n=2 Tax=Leptospira bandrabouensis TaxID=2484903 RepID=UPI001EE9B569|nr:hypothetical protein [Leptospira bandrabouensis]MCG6144902.1 hypothetical protein [Leptospira bandrabouensis]MCG6164393.1 hypothetical protein [Leptospira bandrabouensis]
MKLFAFSVVISLHLVLSILNTGTVTPYGSTCGWFLYDSECNQIANIDHTHFEAVFKFLDGAPIYEISFSVVLRRILYYLIAYPFMKVFGFFLGGVLSNFLIYLLFYYFLYFSNFSKQFNPYYISFLLVTYPGIYYFIGLPYSYNLTVIGSIIIGYLIYTLYQKTSNFKFLKISFIIGILFTGYDFHIWFLIPFLLTIFYYKFSTWIKGTILLLIPSFAVNLLLSNVFGIKLENSNTNIYANTLDGLKSIFNLTIDYDFISNFIMTFGKILLSSTFIIIPSILTLYFCIIFLVKRDFRFIRKHFAFLAIFISITLLFVVINIYQGKGTGQWDFRGDWIARIYQGFIAAYVLGFALKDKVSDKIKTAILIIIVISNATIIISPYFQPKLASKVYYLFYRHGDENQLFFTLKILKPTSNLTCDPKNLRLIKFNDQNDLKYLESISSIK